MKLKYKSLIICLLILFSQVINAQQFQHIMETIEQNSTTLIVLKNQAEATKADSRVGLTPANPEVDFSYLWGSPVVVGNRTDLNVMQTFDFPTVYYYRRKIADGKATKADLLYATERRALLLQAHKICIELVYRNAMKIELDKRLQHAEKLAAAYQTKFDKGEIGILELNKANLNSLTAQKETEQNEIERCVLLAELARLNGGKSISLNDNTFATQMIPADFNEWYMVAESQNPALQTIRQEIEISRRQVQLNKVQGLPKFSAGYMSERIAGTTLQGIGAGISIPLWENKNAVKAAKAQALTLQSTETDAKTQFYNILKNQFEKVKSLQQLTERYKLTLQNVSNADLLQTALDKGQISLIEYIMEQTLYYDSYNKMLETEKDLQQTVAELMQWNNSE